MTAIREAISLQLDQCIERSMYKMLGRGGPIAKCRQDDMRVTLVMRPSDCRTGERGDEDARQWYADADERS